MIDGGMIDTRMDAGRMDKGTVVITVGGHQEWFDRYSMTPTGRRNGPKSGVHLTPKGYQDKVMLEDFTGHVCRRMSLKIAHSVYSQPYTSI